MLKEVRSWLIFSYLLFLYTEALLLTNNWLQFISSSKINIAQLICKQHDAFKLRDGVTGTAGRLLHSPCLTLWLFCRRRGRAPHAPHPATPSAGPFPCPSGLPLPAPPRPTHLRTLWPGWEEMCRKPLHKVSLINSLSEAPGDWGIIISCGYWLNVLELLSCMQWNKTKKCLWQLHFAIENQLCQPSRQALKASR